MLIMLGGAFASVLLANSGVVDSREPELARAGSITGSVRLVGPAPEGTVRFEGTPPDGEPVDMSTDDYCASAHADPVVRRPVRVGENGSLRDVVVFVRSGLSAGDYPVPEEPALLDQEDCLYRPRVIALQAGQKLIIRNSDPTLHNVHVSGERNRGFNIGQPRPGVEAERTFDNAEVALTVECNIHGWMHAYIAVFEHPYFAVTEADGHFELEGLAPGEYLLEAWHPTLGVETQRVNVRADATETVEFVFSGG